MGFGSLSQLFSSSLVRFERGGGDSSTHQCRCSPTSSRQRLDLFSFLFLSYTPLCLVTLDFPHSLYILTDLKGFKESRPTPRQTPPTCPPPPASQKFLSRLHKESLKINVSLLDLMIISILT